MKINEHIELIKPTELAGKTVLLKPKQKFRYPEPYSYKITAIGSNYDNSLFYILSKAFKDNKYLFIEYLFRYADKNNIVEIDKNKLNKFLNISERTIYRWLKELIDNDLLVKIKKNKFMINPDVFINYRRTRNQELGLLVEQYLIYKRSNK